MSNLYQETNITGTEYRRAKRVELTNYRNTNPTISFIEELVTVLDNGRSMNVDVGVLNTEYDASGVIDLLNPETGEPTGSSISQAEVFQALYSFYIKLATDRDNAVDDGSMPPGM